MDIPGLEELKRADPGAAQRLEVWANRLSARLDAAEWAAAHLPALCAAAGRSAVLNVLVDAAREETGAADVCAVWWSGDLRSPSFRLVAGSAGAIPAPDAISRTIVAQASTAGRAVWTEEARTDARFALAQSVVLSVGGAVGCVPLPPDGALYLARPEGGRFRSRSKLRLDALAQFVTAVLGPEDSPPQGAASQPGVPGLIGASRPMRELFAAIRAFAPMPWPALILGQTGTGKEAVARALHELSHRSNSPLVAVNCASVPDELAESTFFGHERGAFTGADRSRDGLLHRTADGTLFLDEVGELSARVQAKLLRVLQEGCYQRVGGEHDLRFRGRIVAATHRSLDKPSPGLTFRNDLFHRLSACVLRVPALNDRREDVPALAAFLLERACAQVPGTAPLALHADVVRRLQQRDWPGNVRELENVLRTGVARAIAWGDETILREHLDWDDGEDRGSDHPTAEGPGAAERTDDLQGLLPATSAFQRRFVREAVEAAGGNKAKAAKRLGVSPQWLHRLLAKWGGEA